MKSFIFAPPSVIDSGFHCVAMLFFTPVRCLRIFCRGRFIQHLKHPYINFRHGVLLDIDASAPHVVGHATLNSQLAGPLSVQKTRYFTFSICSIRDDCGHDLLQTYCHTSDFSRRRWPTKHINPGRILNSHHTCQDLLVILSIRWVSEKHRKRKSVQRPAQRFRSCSEQSRVFRLLPKTGHLDYALAGLKSNEVVADCLRILIVCLPLKKAAEGEGTAFRAYGTSFVASSQEGRFELARGRLSLRTCRMTTFRPQRRARKPSGSCDRTIKLLGLASCLAPYYKTRGSDKLGRGRVARESLTTKKPSSCRFSRFSLPDGSKMPQSSTPESVSLAPSLTLTAVTSAPATNKRGRGGEDTSVHSIATASAEKSLGREVPTVVEPPSSAATVASNIEPNRKKCKTRGGAGGSKQGGVPRKVATNTLKAPNTFQLEFSPEGESSDDELQEQPPVLGRGLWPKRDKASHARASSLSIKPDQWIIRDISTEDEKGMPEKK